MSVYVIRSMNRLEMEGSPDIESIWDARDLADAEAERLTQVNEKDEPRAGFRTDYEVEQWHVHSDLSAV